MVASLGLRAARDLLSPLGVALVLAAAILFFGGGSGNGSVTWIGGAAVVAAVALAATRRRVAGTRLVYGWLVALALTYSRGGMLVAVLVIVAWIALAGAWLESVATLVAAGAPALVAVGVAYALRGVTSDGASHATRVRDGLVFGLALVLCTGVAALLARAPRPRETPLVRRLAARAAALLVLAAGGGR